jgi:hypothetical protein
MLALHAEGGMEFMAPLSLLFLIIILLAVYSFLSLVNKKFVNAKFVELIHQLGMFALAFGVFGTVVGLFQAFRSLSETKEVLPVAVIYGGLKVALITALYGMIIFLFSLLVNLTLRYFSRSSDRVSS